VLAFDSHLLQSVVHIATSLFSEPTKPTSPNALISLAPDDARAQVSEVSLDKHAPLDTRQFANTNSWRFYNSPTCSDVQIVLPACSVAGNVLLGCSGFHLMLPGDILVIHAHRFILAAGSEYFSRKLQEPEYMVCRRATLGIATYIC